MRHLIPLVLLAACSRGPIEHPDLDDTEDLGASDTPVETDTPDPETDEPPVDTLAGDPWLGTASGSYFPQASGGGTTVGRYEFCEGTVDLRRAEGLVGGSFSCIFDEIDARCDGAFANQPEAGPWSYALSCFGQPATDQTLELEPGEGGEGVVASTLATWRYDGVDHIVPMELALP